MIERRYRPIRTANPWLHDLEPSRGHAASTRAPIQNAERRIACGRQCNRRLQRIRMRQTIPSTPYSQIRVRRVAIHTDRQSIGSNDHRLRFLSLQRQLRNAECLVVVVPYRIALLVSCQAQSRTVSSEFVHLLRCASRISCGARSKPDGMPCWGKSTPCIKRLRILPAQRRTSLLG
jgi:hypothetical protein